MRLSIRVSQRSHTADASEQSTNYDDRSTFESMLQCLHIQPARPPNVGVGCHSHPPAGLSLSAGPDSATRPHTKAEAAQDTEPSEATGVRQAAVTDRLTLGALETRPALPVVPELNDCQGSGRVTGLAGDDGTRVKDRNMQSAARAPNSLLDASASGDAAATRSDTHGQQIRGADQSAVEPPQRRGGLESACKFPRRARDVATVARDRNSLESHASERAHAGLDWLLSRTEGLAAPAAAVDAAQRREAQKHFSTRRRRRDARRHARRARLRQHVSADEPRIIGAAVWPLAAATAGKVMVAAAYQEAKPRNGGTAGGSSSESGEGVGNELKLVLEATGEGGTRVSYSSV